jgi:hypothetical protein
MQGRRTITLPALRKDEAHTVLYTMAKTVAVLPTQSSLGKTPSRLGALGIKWFLTPFPSDDTFSL